MTTDTTPAPDSAVFRHTVRVALEQLKRQLQHDYEQAYPGLREIIHLVLDEEECNARRLSARERSMDVGFIGLGQMGQAMALNLVKAGHRVAAYNRTRGDAPPAKIIHTYHGHVLEGYFSPLMTRMFIGFERMLARVSDRIVAISPASGEKL